MADQDSAASPDVDPEADTSPHSDTDKAADAGTGGAPNPGGPGGPGGIDEILRNFAKMQADAAQSGATPMTDAITQALVMVLGSGPSVAAYESLLQSQQANGMMYLNAVANQQKTNLLGMAMTAKCVRYMLDPQSAGSLDEAFLGAETQA